MSTLSRARMRAPQGWAGGPPRARAPLAWRALLAVCQATGALLGLRLRVEGAEHLPDGPCLIAAAPHRSWLDPFVLLFALPAEPRVYFLGDGEAIYRDPVRAFFVRRLGGVVPVWRGGFGIEPHVAAAREILASGARLALFPERGPAVPVERARPFSWGIGHLARLTGAAVAPAVLGGTHELYLGRRVAVRFLVPISPAWTGDEQHRAAAHALVRDLGETMAPHVADLLRATEPPPTFRKRWRWLTTAFH